MDIFWWAVLIIAVISVAMLGIGLAVVIPLRNALRRRQGRSGYYVDPAGNWHPMPGPQQPSHPRRRSPGPGPQ
ncbi:hypothetical protein ATK30_2174 [Amycolatopsis echigonensis]|uniref:Uncharacterized protein n=1 Tax=Amycolatopsis echigonensis TaxID=2576905 RepID=A0A2N3WC27_9PSEU|nr:hypothetical protein ATK30_2174 [Amycolatopsis niigatensis]